MSYGPITSSSQLTANQQIYQRSGSFYGAIIAPPSSGIATLTVYDNANSQASGTVLLAMEQFAGNSAQPAIFTYPMAVQYGIYCVFSGTNSNYIAYYSG